MRSIHHVLTTHEVQTSHSCIAWTIEFILKLHDKIPDGDYTRQLSGKAFGFGADEKADLKTFDIYAIDNSYEFDEFERISRADAALGFPLVFSLASTGNINIQSGTFHGYTSHGCVAAHINSVSSYLFRGCGVPHVFRCSPLLVYRLVRDHIKTDYKIHCLRHRPVGIPL